MQPVSIYYAYEAVRKSAHLADIPAERHLFGGLGDLPVSASPRILWTPTTDRYEAPLHSALPFVDGKRVEVESIFSRLAGVDVELVVPAGPQGQIQLDDLIRRFHLALREYFKASGNYSVGSGRNVPRDKVSTNTLVYIQSLAIKVPIFDLVPAQLWEETEVGMKRG